MKLAFRGHSYETPAPLQPGSDSIDRPNLKLIYRGHTYYATPYPVVVSDVDTREWKTVTLIYRGNTYKRKLQPSVPYQKPRAINWRYQMLAEV